MREYYTEDGYEFDHLAARDAVETLIQDEKLGRLWVAGNDQNVEAYLAVTRGFSLEYQGADAFIDELYVASPCRGKGLGREALNVAMEYCRSTGIKALHLEAERHRKTALAIYRNAGFEDHDRYLMTKRIHFGIKEKRAKASRDPTD